MTSKQRTATAIGAVIGLVFGFVAFDDDRSLIATACLAVVFAIVAGSIGFVYARRQRERQ